MRLEGEAWAERFRTFRAEAFRLETLPQYLVPQERDTFAAFLAGAAPPEPDPADQWAAVIAAARERGAAMRRVHVLTPPLTDYLNFEMTWYYCASVSFGEDIRILDLSRTPDPGVGLDEGDFWMFDDEDVVDMLYAGDGTQTGRELRENPDLDRYRRRRDLAWAAAVPFADYDPDPDAGRA